MGKETIRKREYSGWLFSYEISGSRFTFKLFRLLPMGTLRLDDVRVIRQRSGVGVWGLLSEMSRRPLLCQYWPQPMLCLSSRGTTPYVIEMVSGRKVFVRLRPGYHYSLRAAVGEARARKQTAWMSV